MALTSDKGVCCPEDLEEFPTEEGAGGEAPDKNLKLVAGPGSTPSEFEQTEAQLPEAA